MIIGNYFKGDNDEKLKNLQHSVYSKNVSLLYSKPRREYIDAVKLTGVQTELYKKIKDKRSYKKLFYLC